MAPTKSSRNAAANDDKDNKEKDKSGALGPQNTNGKMRRVASQQQAARDQQANSAPAQPTTPQEPVSVQWHNLDRKFLHAYCREYNLDTPFAFEESYRHFVFARAAGIGHQSPTMARRKRQQQRQTKEQLALAVRKHFNSIGVQENDVIVDLIHAIHDRGDKKAARSPAEGS
ncbi:uncharacterized protein DNG_08693 [Cephalotrichum gorgonifer]|uniref:Histone deacetylase complex subunit SAP30 Sin3 binding domain-containing protein n=1 Tax=Cephalotrichum gorgonifer TaxID=2041049 RepID=A0AAE8N5Q9_9PEZI|nr:uncharacterized protein DNG_08693 [Cephalotrichum gorgonifer]